MRRNLFVNTLFVMTNSPHPPARLIAQLLETLQRDGLSHWANVPPPAPTVVSAPALVRGQMAASNPGLTASHTVRPVPPQRALPAARQEITPLMATFKPLPIVTAPFVPLDLPVEERIRRLDELRQKVAACQRCPELAQTRQQTVFGTGSPTAKIAFVGEAPGADEDEQGEPFVGRGGQLLNDIIKACRMKREDIYICNVLRCRPPGNRVPSPEEAGNCREYLDGQLAIVNPDYIVCWGSTPAKALLATNETIGKLRGQFFTYGRAKLLCTYHPAYLLRNPPAKKFVWDDMKLLLADMGVDLKTL